VAGNGVGGGVPTAAAVWTRLGTGVAIVTASGLVRWSSGRDCTLDGALRFVFM